MGGAVGGNNSDVGYAPECVDRVCHAEELAFVFHSNLSLIPGVGTWADNAAESVLSLSMIDYWGNMATALDPKSTSIPGSGPPLLWPAMNMQTQSTMRFRAGEGASRLESS